MCYYYMLESVTPLFSIASKLPALKVPAIPFFILNDYIILNPPPTTFVSNLLPLQPAIQGGTLEPELDLSTLPGEPALLKYAGPCPSSAQPCLLVVIPREWLE